MQYAFFNFSPGSVFFRLACALCITMFISRIIRTLFVNTGALLRAKSTSTYLGIISFYFERCATYLTCSVYHSSYGNTKTIPLLPPAIRAPKGCCIFPRAISLTSVLCEKLIVAVIVGLPIRTYARQLTTWERLSDRTCPRACINCCWVVATLVLINIQLSGLFAIT